VGLRPLFAGFHFLTLGNSLVCNYCVQFFIFVPLAIESSVMSQQIIDPVCPRHTAVWSSKFGSLLFPHLERLKAF
jgi:hypothetical protein